MDCGTALPEEANSLGAIHSPHATHHFFLRQCPDSASVALAVPLDITFTYRIPADATPVVGGRVLVPFRQKRMSGIVVEVHDRAPSVTTARHSDPARPR